jgi:hypothetical protein
MSFYSSYLKKTPANSIPAGLPGADRINPAFCLIAIST